MLVPSPDASIPQRCLNDQDHWEWFTQRFQEALDDLPEIPEATKRRAVASVATTRAHFRPLSPDELARGVRSSGRAVL